MSLNTAWLSGAAIAAILPITTVHAADTAALATKFAAPEAVRNMSISPDGNKIVFVGQRDDGGQNAVVVDLANGGGKAILSSKGGDEQLTSCIFVTQDRVICRFLFRQGSNRKAETATRLITVGADGSDMRMLTAATAGSAYYSSNWGGSIVDYNSSDPKSVLMQSWKPEEKTVGTMLARKGYGLMVEEVDLYSGKRKQVISPVATGYDFIGDGQGNVRIKATMSRNDRGYSEREIKYFYKSTDGDWKDLSTVTFDGGVYTGFEPIAVDGRENVAYGFDTDGNYQKLYKIKLDGSMEKTEVLGRSSADVDGLVRIGRDQRVIGASYSTDYRHTNYFDKQYAALASGLSAALGGDKQIGIVDATTGEEKLIVYAGSDVDPGTYYLYDKTSQKLGQILPVRPDLEGVQAGHMKPIRFTASDGTEIPGYLTLPAGSDGKGLPAIVMPHGGPSSRDEWGFDWLVQFFAANGYAVLQPNYRGSSGFGANFFQKNGFQSWRTAIGDIDDAGRWLVQQGIAAPDKLAIVGWSYGGYAALQSGVTEPGLYKAIVAIAPVTDLERLKSDSRDSANYRIVENFVGSGPHVAAGSPAMHADKITAPVLLVHGDADLNVLVGHSREMNEKLKAAGKDVKYVEIEGLAHSLNDKAARTRLLVESEALIHKALKLP